MLTAAQPQFIARFNQQNSPRFKSVGSWLAALEEVDGQRFQVGSESLPGVAGVAGFGLQTGLCCSAGGDITPTVEAAMSVTARSPRLR